MLLWQCCSGSLRVNFDASCSAAPHAEREEEATHHAVSSVHEFGKLNEVRTVVGLELGQSSVLPGLVPDGLHPLAGEQRTAALVETREGEHGTEVSLTSDLGDDVERESSEGAERALESETRSVMSTGSSCKDTDSP